MRSWFLCLCSVLSYGLLSPCFAAPPPWSGGSYAYYAQKSPLGTVLSDFCKNFGVQLKMGSGVSGVVNGRISGANPSEFLDLLTSAYGLKWFFAEGVLYVVSATDWQTQSIAVSPATIPALRQAMLDLRLLDERFGWAELQEQGLLLISGPKDYVALLKEAISSLDLAPSGARFAVFRLRYASVDDRTVTLRDQQVTIPGVASILRNLVEGSERVPGAVSSVGAGSAGGLSATASLADSPNRVSAATSAERKPGAKPLLEAGRRSSIQADSRLNAVVIKDAPEMIAVYEKLIASLDLPTRLVEIEAMIVDISKTRLTELGVDWTASGGVLAATVGDFSIAPTSGSGVAAINLGGKDSSNVLRNGVAGLLARIRALEELNDAKILGKPMILTTDNSAAVIDLSQTFFTSVSGERVANLVPVTTGVLLKVVPHIINKPDGTTEIQLEVDIEDGTLIDRKGLALPIVQKSTISTQAIIKEKQSLLLGGFSTQEQTDEGQSVPFFGKLPLIGFMFRNNSSSSSRRERLFMITPRVVENSIADYSGQKKHIAFSAPTDKSDTLISLPHNRDLDIVLPAQVGRNSEPETTAVIASEPTRSMATARKSGETSSVSGDKSPMVIPLSSNRALNRVMPNSASSNLEPLQVVVPKVSKPREIENAAATDLSVRKEAAPVSPSLPTNTKPPVLVLPSTRELDRVSNSASSNLEPPKVVVPKVSKPREIENVVATDLSVRKEVAPASPSLPANTKSLELALSNSVSSNPETLKEEVPRLIESRESENNATTQLPGTKKRSTILVSMEKNAPVIPMPRNRELNAVVPNRLLGRNSESAKQVLGVTTPTVVEGSAVLDVSAPKRRSIFAVPNNQNEPVIPLRPKRDGQLNASSSLSNAESANTIVGPTKAAENTDRQDSLAPIPQ
ncbi:MAG: type III secretion system outer membrane ring subunit SctC [Pseudomonadota bacterium]